MSGVARCASLDVARLEPPNVRFYEQLVDLVEAVDGFRWWRPFSDQEFPGVEFPVRGTRPDPANLSARIERRTWSPGPRVDEPDGAFDAVYSIATFKHLDDPRGVLREATRVLAADGVMIHEIDLTHHSSPEPLRFLTWEEEEWLKKAGKYGDEVTLRRILDGEWKGEVYCNRLRIDDWLALFRESGLVVMALEPLITLSRESIQRESFVAPFRDKSLDDLSVLAFRAVLRRG